MSHVRLSSSVRKGLATAVAAVGLLVSTASFAADMTLPFTGKAVNRGTVAHEVQGGKDVLTMSADFQVPDSPDPHWQVIDSQGNTYLLDRVKLKDEKINRSITIPAYIPNVARVQMWCAWAEVVLGEAPFTTPVAMK
jgi:hypothetical protein